MARSTAHSGTLISTGPKRLSDSSIRLEAVANDARYRLGAGLLLIPALTREGPAWFRLALALAGLGVFALLWWGWLRAVRIIEFDRARREVRVQGKFGWRAPRLEWVVPFVDIKGVRFFGAEPGAPAQSTRVLSIHLKGEELYLAHVAGSWASQQLRQDLESLLAGTTGDARTQIATAPSAS